MAAPIPKEKRDEIKEYLKDLDLSELTSTQIGELVSKDLEISMSQPTASRYKREIMDDSEFMDDREIMDDDQKNSHPMTFTDLRQFCRTFFEDEGFDILCDMARTGSHREKLEVIKLVLQYGYGKPSKEPDLSTPDSINPFM